MGAARRALAQIDRQIARRSVVAGSVVGWAAFTTVVVIALSLNVTTTLLLSTAGLIAVGLLYLHHHHHQVVHELRHIRDRMDSVERGVKTSGANADETLDRLRLTALHLGRISADIAESTEAVKKAVTDQHRELEALANLHAIVPVAGHMPPMWQWGVSADVMLVLIDLVRTTRPRLVLECGSGVTTLWLALAIERFGTGSRLVSLEDDLVRVRRTVELLSSHGVAHVADVRPAPVELSYADGQQRAWYAARTWSDLEAIDLLVVGGPKGEPSQDPVFPAPLMLAKRLSDEARIALRGGNGQPHTDIVDRWLATVPALTLDQHTSGNGLTVLRAGSSYPGTAQIPAQRTLHTSSHLVRSVEES